MKLGAFSVSLNVRDIKRSKDFCIKVDESSKGPASFMIKDPDGNLILIDQHR
jgi:hypothetical protein